MADVLGFLGDIAFPTAMALMRQREAQQQAQQILGQQGQQYQQGMGQGMLQNIPGTGLLGGELTPQRMTQAGTKLLGVPGYENVGLNLLRQTMPNPSSYSPYYTPVQTSTGIYGFNARTGELNPMMGPGGKQLLPPSMDPYAQQMVSGAKSYGGETGKARATAQIGLPGILSQTSQTLDIINQAISHPGRETYTGMSGYLDPRNVFPGSDAWNYKILQRQLQGKTFMQAYQTLKGGGQITEIEGQKAQDAIARLDSSQSDSEYLKALNELKDIVQKGQERAVKQAYGQNADVGGILQQYGVNTGQTTNPSGWSITPVQ